MFRSLSSNLLQALPDTLFSRLTLLKELYAMLCTLASASVATANH